MKISKINGSNDGLMTVMYTMYSHCYIILHYGLILSVVSAPTERTVWCGKVQESVDIKGSYCISPLIRLSSSSLVLSPSRLRSSLSHLTARLRRCQVISVVCL